MEAKDHCDVWLDAAKNLEKLCDTPGMGAHSEHLLASLALFATSIAKAYERQIQERSINIKFQ